MKKLLMLGAILALGTTMAYGAETATADVKVIAEIVNENFMITDLDGDEIVLDFGKISGVAYQMGNSTVREVSEGYKITYIGADIESSNSYSNKAITMTLKDTDEIGIDNNKPADGTNVSTKVLMRRQVTTGDEGDNGNDTITSNIFLSEYSGNFKTANALNSGDTVYVGQIGGFIKGSDLGNTAPADGDYQGFALLTVTVAE